MSTDAQLYLAVLKASYAYAPQSDDEIAIREDQLLLLVERTDDDWWKVRPKADSPDAEEQPAGLVPSAYVDQAEPTATVKAQYAYDAAAPGELTVAEDDLLHTFGPEEDGWLLVQARGKDGAGYVPANYVEESTEEAEEAAPAAAAPILANIVVPDSPPRPARPVSTYADPADLVASSTKARAAAPAASDAIQTWAVSEVDKKGKKKKGTLGVGNGAVFFASESDKTPVQKWQTADVASSKIDKTKHILIEIGGSGAGGAPASLHFHAGSKDAAEAIAAKLDASRALATAAAVTATAESGPGAVDGVGPGASVGAGAGAGKKGASVHFSEQGPAIIPPREDGDEEDGADEDEGEDPSDPDAAHVQAHVSAHAGEAAVALYDFAAQGDDEMSVAEGEALWIVERDGDEWWKCRNARGEEGVVPASYVEPSGSGAPAPAPLAAAAAEEEEEEEEEDTAAQEAEARASAERAQKERKKIEQEQRAKAAAAAAAEVDRKRKERDAREAEQKAKERAEADARKRETPSPSPSPSPRPSSSSSSSKPRASTDQPSRSSIDKRGPPPSEKTRVWHDRSGQFRVEAAFLGFANGKIRLHKVNGVVIEVPSEKMSVEDMRFVERVTGRAQPQRRASDDDDEPLAHRRSSLKAPPRSATAPPSAAAQAQAPKKPTIDWFEFFLNAGCDVDDCTRYASAFERDKMDAQILPDITESTMRSLGLREGDIIRVRKAIAARTPPPPSAGAGDAEQVRRDEELARQLQAEESTRPVAPPPNLFAAGPGGALKSTRRGRPPPSKTGPLASVALGAIATASDQIQRSSTPQASSAAPSPAPAAPSVLPPAVPPPSGFDDDAWTPRPSSTKPAATPPVLEPRAPSAPPAPSAPAPAAQRVASPPAAAPVQPQPTSGGSLAKTTESDIFDQLARLSQLRVRSPPAVSLSVSASASLNASAAPSPAIVSPPPGGYAQGMGMGSSPVPLGQHLHAQQTGLLPPPRAPSVGGGGGGAASGPRGPYAPVPANQTLLQPLIPTTTGFGGFVPTRGSQASPFQPQQQPPQQFQQQFQQPQQPSFLSTQPTGFNAQPMLPQQTGFQMSGPLMSQPTGFGGYGGGGGALPPPPVPPLPSFQSSNSFGQMQPSPTGFNPGFGQPPSFNGGGMHSGLPPQQQQQQGKDTSPANIFAQMKAGTFANDAAPQSSDKYDALRPAPAQLTAQPTGWGYPGFPGGYGGYQ